MQRGAVLCLSLCRSAGVVSLLISLAGCGAHRSPVVLWDVGHHNFSGGNAHETLPVWISRNGYRVRPFHGQFEQAVLSEADIVVIRMALAAVNDT